MSRDITEMMKGDFIKVGPGQYEEIERVDPPMTPGGRVPRNWTITTKSGKSLSMRDGGYPFL